MGRLPPRGQQVTDQRRPRAAQPSGVQGDGLAAPLACPAPCPASLHHAAATVVFPATPELNALTTHKLRLGSRKR
ncbi:hypothetical protein BN2476_660007 [Paraburkholderia piptadeniae]|uniref:Uncharacterized protein n=1 Tax=Paraburkholderia piptadeniae TaxID=1701573 RepID=A0A1N7SPN4_9BURK|nr:hypothetical protein BN2476_660007 [Paraburkholderia piptadeniae]